MRKKDDETPGMRARRPASLRLEVDMKCDAGYLVGRQGFHLSNVCVASCIAIRDGGCSVWMSLGLAEVRSNRVTRERRLPTKVKRHRRREAWKCV